MLIAKYTKDAIRFPIKVMELVKAILIMKIPTVRKRKDKRISII